MSPPPRSLYSNAWPAPTPAPFHPLPLADQRAPSMKRRRRFDEASSSAAAAEIRLRPRQTIADSNQVQQALSDCYDSSNDVVTCLPTSDTNVPQNEWVVIVWNSRLPNFAQTNTLNITLYRADSGAAIASSVNVPNPTNGAGQSTFNADDAWWGAEGPSWKGQNISFPFYFVVTPNDPGPDQIDTPQATFAGVQTTYPNSIIASMSSASAASASSASVASLSSASAASASSASVASASSAAAASRSSLNSGNPSATGGGSGSGSNPSGTNGGGVPSSSSSPGGAGSVQSAAADNFPHWAIAVIVVLGFLALVAGGVLAFFMTRRIRARRNSTLSHRGSMGSSTPMMQGRRGDAPLSPVIGGALLGGARAPTPTDTQEVHDGASTISRASDTAPFSGADAAIMADAFRKALRKPEFPQEGESPDSQGTEHPTGALLSQELAEEGRDIRSVGSSRGVRVETLDEFDHDGHDGEA